MIIFPQFICMKNSLILFLFLVSGSVFGQNPPGLSLVKEADIKKDVYEICDPVFRGRGGGTIDELNASVWLAEKFRSIGISPAGDHNTYFQYFNLWRNELSDRSNISINGKTMELWKEVAVSQLASTTLEAPIVYLGDPISIDTAAIDVKGKVVAMLANPKGINLDVSLPTWRYNRYVYARYGAIMVRKGATAVIFVADDVAEQAWMDAAENLKRGTYDIEGGPNVTVTATVPVIWVRKSMGAMLQSGATLKANIIISKFQYPSVNVVGMIPGTDPKLKSEYLLLSSHIDAHGVRNPVNGDSIYYGADDNASVTAAILASARAYVKYPPKRSVLLVIHGSEERGLLGSRYYAAHPTVPLDNIVTVLNGDMIGRNHPDSATILGAVAPHKNSTELVNMAIAANNEGPKFILDSTWDAVTHIEGWYFRSDHLPYARLGIPALMYTTLLHPDYHTPLDNPQNINYPKLKKMADWIYRTGWKVANAPVRPARDKDFKLER
jgi:Peptidase family M28